MKLRIAANFPNPYFYTIEKNNISIVNNGLDFHLINTIMNYLNHSYELIHADWEWGQQIGGKWTGLIGKITDKFADMAMGALSATPDRHEVVDFTFPYDYSDVTFFSRKTNLNAMKKSSILVKPFSVEVWLCLVLSIPFSLLIMKIMKKQILEVFRIIIRALFHQNIPSIPSDLKFFTIIWIFSAMFLSQIYLSILALHMSELIPRSRISTIEELAIAVKNGEYVPAVSAEGSLYNFIKNIDISPLNAIGMSLIGINQINKAMKLMLTSLPYLTYICPRRLFEARTDSLTEKLFDLPSKNEKSTFTIEQLTIAVPKNSALKAKINKLIRRIETSGHIHHWERIFNSEHYSFKELNNYIERKDERLGEGVGFNTINYIFYLWFTGLTIALFVYFCEALVKSFKKIVLLNSE